MARLTWSQRSLRDVDALGEYIARDSPRVAQSVVRRIFAAVEILEEFPRSGRMVPEFGLDDIRELIVFRYRIVYRIIGEDVEIGTVQHGAMPLQDYP